MANRRGPKAERSGCAEDDKEQGQPHGLRFSCIMTGVSSDLWKAIFAILAEQSIRGRSKELVDYKGTDGAAGGFNPQSELSLHGGEEARLR